MSRNFRRYEMLLPRKFNDGRPVPEERFQEVLLELRDKFGAESLETQVIHGVWHYEDRAYHDELMRVFVDVHNDPENRQFFLEFKERVRQKFEQVEVWLTTFPVEVI